MRLLLDEHLDPGIAERLHRLGHDVVAVAADAELRGSADETLLEWATANDRVVVTYDARGFMPLIERRASADLDCAGVVFVSSRSYPLGDRGHGALVRDVARLLREHPARDALRRSAVWLASD